MQEVLDSMVDTEFWYAEGSSRARKGRKWWLPSPRVPDPGLSLSQRKKLGFQGKCVFQVMKAVKAINEQILLQIPLPDSVKSALPKVNIDRTFLLLCSSVINQIFLLHALFFDPQSNIFSPLSFILSSIKTFICFHSC